MTVAEPSEAVRCLHCKREIEPDWSAGVYLHAHSDDLDCAAPAYR